MCLENDDIAEFLIDKRAEVNHVSNDGTTALLTAVISGNKKLVKNLIDKWVDTNKATKNGLSPLYIATLKGMMIKIIFKNNVSDYEIHPRFLSFSF